MLRVLVGLGDLGRPADAIVIDHRNATIWVRGRAEYRSHKPGCPAFLVRAMYMSRIGRGPIRTEEIIDCIWGDDPECGPVGAYNFVSVVFYQARQLFRGAGLDVIQNYTRGFSLEWRRQDGRRAA